MNRIILIGNGFDLAHGLKTSYKDFIDWFWKEKIKSIVFKETNSPYPDEKYRYTDDDIVIKLKNKLSFIDVSNYSKLKKINKHNSLEKFEVKNKFLKIISDALSSNDWVDVEELYNKYLQEIIVPPRSGYREILNIEELNQYFKTIKEVLEKYLKEEIVDKSEQKSLDNILNVIYSRFKLKDFTQIGSERIIEEEYQELEHYKNFRESLFPQNYRAITDYLLRNLEANNIPITKQEIKRLLITQSGFSSDFHLLPKEILFLNFNYTNTENSYSEYNYFKDKSERLNSKMIIEKDTIHIHGELNNEKNPIIFGYGDEIADGYKVIENKNDNQFLENIKSIKYLETDNYKRLLSFIDSDYYQIFIMGHSCGLSDRTLLNKLFEHEHCVSIKVFYHQKHETDDNYSEVIRNISRNFNDKAVMREKVVNKQYCEPLLNIRHGS